MHRAHNRIKLEIIETFIFLRTHHILTKSILIPKYVDEVGYILNEFER